MSLNRYDKRRDAQEPLIIGELRAKGFLVRQQDYPDLAIRHPDWPLGRCVLLEVDGITRNRKRSAKQLAFLAEWNIPRVKSTAQALAVLQESSKWIIPR